MKRFKTGKKRSRRFAGFGVATAGQGMMALRRAGMDAEDGHCGKALEALGKAKVLLGSHARSPATARLVAEVERYCPKNQLVLRADVVEEMQATRESLLPSNYERDERIFRQRYERTKPRAQTRYMPGEGYVWTAPTAEESRAWRRELLLKKLVGVSEGKGRGGRPRSSTSKYQAKKPHVRRKGKSLGPVASTRGRKRKSKK